MSCCSVNDAFSCAAGLLGIAQITVQWACFFLVTFLFLIFIPRHHEDESSDNPAEISDSAANTAVGVVAIAVAHFITVFILSVVFLARFPQHIQTFANALGVSSSILASIQYIPQIWTTWKLQDVKSLSIPMMCIQTPGSFVWVVSLAVRLGPEGWSAWTVYLVTGCLQGCLLVMGIMFILRDRKLKRTAVNGTQSTPGATLGESDMDDADETSPLLSRDDSIVQNPSTTYVSLNGRPPDDSPSPSPANQARVERSDTITTSLQRFFTSRTSQG